MFEEEILHSINVVADAQKLQRDKALQAAKDEAVRKAAEAKFQHDQLASQRKAS